MTMTMQRKDLVALVAGASVGVAGGALGAILASTVGGKPLYRLVDQLGWGDQYIELRPPAGPSALCDTQTASSGSASLTQPASGPPPPLPPPVPMSLPHVKEAVTASQAPRH
jgi:hypothetical protein